MSKRFFDADDAQLVADCIGTRFVSLDKAGRKLVQAGLAHNDGHADGLLDQAARWGMLDREGPNPLDVTYQPPGAPSPFKVRARPGAKPVWPAFGGPPKPTVTKVLLIGPNGVEVEVDPSEVDVTLARWQAERNSQRLAALKADIAAIEGNG